MSDSHNHNETGKRGHSEQKVHGVVEGPCPKCEETIPEGTLACPHCGYQRSFDQKQYDMLMRCSEARDISEWNRWRNDHSLEIVRLESASLRSAKLQRASLSLANLQRADLSFANLQGTKLRRARLQGANLGGAQLQGTKLRRAQLQGANLWRANLQGANLLETNLQGANLLEANLQGTDLDQADLTDAVAWLAEVDGNTLVTRCRVDDRTDFTGVGVGSACMDPSIRARLEYNIRRLGWRRWYRENWLRQWILQWPVRLFWSLSDYGRSSVHIILWFIVLCGMFGLTYCHFPDLLQDSDGDLTSLVPRMRLLRSTYFSVVTMTTLGFGDIRANPKSPVGHIVLSIHVLLGYVLLGALITRFAMMFQGVTVPWDRPPRPKGRTSGQGGGTDVD